MSAIGPFHTTNANYGLYPVLLGLAVAVAPIGIALIGFLLAGEAPSAGFATIVAFIWALGVTTAVGAACLLHQRYEVWPDRIRIAGSWRFKRDLPFEKLGRVRHAQCGDLTSTKAAVGSILPRPKFAPSYSPAVVIAWRPNSILHRDAILLSPYDPDTFITCVADAIEHHREHT